MAEYFQPTTRFNHSRNYNLLKIWEITFATFEDSQKFNNMSLHEAAWSGNLADVELFLQRGADVHSENDRAIVWSCANGHLQVAERLLDAGANADGIFAAVAGDGQVEMVKLLLKKGTQVNDRALVLAAAKGNLEVVMVLVDVGMDVTVMRNRPLKLALRNNHLHVAEYLMEHGAVFNPEWGDFPNEIFLIKAANLLQILFLANRNKVPMHVIDDLMTKFTIDDDVSLIHSTLLENLDSVFGMAASEGHMDMIDVLKTDPRVDIHAANDAAFRFACSSGHLKVVEWFLENGANVHALDDDALHAASENHHLDVFHLLVQRGAQF